MLSKLRIQRYKSLFDTEVDLEPLTVFIGPNGSGKSNLCEALAVWSDFLTRVMEDDHRGMLELKTFFTESLQAVGKNQQNLKSKFWHGEIDKFLFAALASPQTRTEANHHFPQKQLELSMQIDCRQQPYLLKIPEDNTDYHYVSQLRNSLVSSYGYLESPFAHALKKVRLYDFGLIHVSNNAAPDSSIDRVVPMNGLDRSEEGVVNALVRILHTNRESFDELEQRLTELVPNIKRITLPPEDNRTFSLELVDRYSNHHIPAADISDGTLRILAFLTALYQENTPSILCFEELENGVHPWLLHKMIELLKTISTQGITGQPVQVLITTHSPVLLNYVEPHQVRAVELDEEGKTQVHVLPVDSVRFQKAMAAYDGALGELWFTNIFGGNPV